MKRKVPTSEEISNLKIGDFVESTKGEGKITAITKNFIIHELDGWDDEGIINIRYGEKFWIHI